MAAGSKPAPAANGTAVASKSLELAVTLQHSPGMRIHLHLTILSASVTLFLTNSHVDSTPATAALGSFVYAMPDRYNPSQPMSTPLYALPSSLDFATRIAKLVARKAKRPCYVGSSINLTNAAGGGSVEEEIEASRAVANVVSVALKRSEGESEDHGDDDGDDDDDDDGDDSD